MFLLKNSIVEDTGVPSYAFFSEACADAMMLGELKEGMITHSETYDHVGEIKGYVYNLKPVLARARLERRIFIHIDDSTNVIEGTFQLNLLSPGITCMMLSTKDRYLEWRR